MSLNYKLDPKTDRHKKLLAALEDRLKLSHQEMSKRYKVWQDVERSMRAYIPESDLDKKRRTKREGGTPDYTTIYIPHAYSLLMTFHTYAATVFLGRRPVFQYTARHGQGMGSVMAVEALIDYQMQVGQNLIPLYLWLYDTLKYGIGVVCNYWDSQETVVSSIEEVDATMLGGLIKIPGKKKKVRVGKLVKGYSGNKLFNVRPQDWFPDPRVPLSRFHDGEFCGRYIEEAWSTVLDKKARDVYMNVDFIRDKLKAQQTSGMAASSAETDRDEGDTRSGELPNAALTAGNDGIPDHGYMKAYEMVVRLVPKQWDLGESERVELWSFTFVRNLAIIKARPYGAWHGRFPFEALSYELDGYALFNRGLVEMALPMEGALTWLLNSHLYNVRKELNGTIIYDPMRIDEEDLLDPNPGKRVKIKPGFMGTNVRDALMQVEGRDFTRSHIQDMQIIDQLSYKVFGINDNIMGAVNTGGRKTATEVRHSSTFGINRLKNQCEWWSNQAFSPLAQVMLQNSQQYYDSDLKLRIVRDLALSAGQDFADVNPDTIAGFYDFVAVDGTLPVDRFAQAALWKDLLVMFRGLPPQITAQFDIVPIIMHAMTLAGAPDITQFRAKVLPPGMAPPPGAVPMPAAGQGAPIVAGQGPVA